MIERFII